VTRLVIDASVAVKWFLHEADSAKALSFLSAGSDLAAPEILKQEVASALVRAYRNGRIDRSRAEHVLANAANMLSSAAIQLVDVGPLHARAETVALDLKHAFMDGLYVALAESLGCDLVTTDTSLLARASPHFSFVKPL
jgi:predicted nucleic acid-binding protein